MRSTISFQPKRSPAWTSAPFTKDRRIPLIVFGNAMFGAKKNGQKMKGQKAGIVNIIWREVKRRERAGDLVAVTIDEYLSSQVSKPLHKRIHLFLTYFFKRMLYKICHSCHERNLEKVKTEDHITHHGVLACKSCGTLWQRDVVASKNLYWIAQSAWAGHGRPEEFQRPSNRNHIAATNAVSLVRARD
jgi:hypothetical protein